MNLVQDSHSLNKVSKIWQFWACRPGQPVPFPGSTYNSGWATAGGPKEPSMLTGFLRLRPFKALPFLCSTLARERQKFYCPCLRLCTFDQRLSLSSLSTLVIPDIHIPLCFRKFRGFRAKASEIMQGLLFWVCFISPIAHFPDTASWQIAYFFLSSLHSITYRTAPHFLVCSSTDGQNRFRVFPPGNHELGSTDICLTYRFHFHWMHYAEVVFLDHTYLGWGGTSVLASPMGALFHVLPLPPHWRVCVRSFPSCCFHTAMKTSHITWFLQHLSPLSCPDVCYNCVLGTFCFTSADNNICALHSSGHSQRTLSKLGVWALRITRQILLSSVFFFLWILDCSEDSGHRQVRAESPVWSNGQQTQATSLGCRHKHRALIDSAKVVCSWAVLNWFIIHLLI